MADQSFPAKPNIVIVLADDMGLGDLGCEGATMIRTPMIDRMAAEGIRFTDFYASANVCTPSRAGLLTGRFAVRAGLAHEVLQPADTKGLPLDAPTIPAMLQAAGYHTALIGKWHLGHQPPFWPPTVYGFTAFHGLPYSHDMRPLSQYSADGRGVSVTAAKVDFAELTRVQFGDALKEIEAAGAQPFFVLLALTAPHIPLRPHPEEQNASPAGLYGDVIEEIDAHMGRLFAALKARGLDENTLVIFTSDNGPWFEGSTARLRDRKGGAGFDGGYRVPMIARWPAGIAAGGVTSALSSNLDFLPTFAALSGADLPPAEYDGKDISAVLRHGAPSPHDEIVLFDNANVAAIRTADWKYVARSYYRRFDIDLGAHNYPLLFNVSADPGETYNVAARHPEALADMRARFERAKALYDPIAAGFAPHIAPASAADHPD